LAFSATFLALLDPFDCADTFEEALGRLVATTLTGSSEEESDEESEEESCFLVGFFLLSTFLALFLESSIDCFLDGASDDWADAFFSFFY
jgi:hypothetical protein